MSKSIHQIARFQFQKYKISQLLKGDVAPPVHSSGIWHCDPPPPIITKIVKKLIYAPGYRGGTCNFEVGEEFGEGFGRWRLGQKKKLLYWSNPPDPNFTPYPRHFYLFIYLFFLRRKNKNKSIIMDIKVGKPQNMQLYVRRKVKMFRSPILLCGYGLCVQV